MTNRREFWKGAGGLAVAGLIPAGAAVAAPASEERWLLKALMFIDQDGSSQGRLDLGDGIPVSPDREVLDDATRAAIEGWSSNAALRHYYLAPWGEFFIEYQSIRISGGTPRAVMTHSENCRVPTSLVYAPKFGHLVPNKAPRLLRHYEPNPAWLQAGRPFGLFSRFSNLQADRDLGLPTDGSQYKS